MILADQQVTTTGLQILTAVISSITPIAVIGLVKILRGLRNDQRRFMTEHLFLLAHANWSVTSIKKIMDHLGLEPDEPPTLKNNTK